MANASQLFKDDEDERSGDSPSDDELRHLTGITPDEEAAMEREARRGTKQDIAQQESQPGAAAGDTGSSGASAEGLASAEEGATGVPEIPFDPHDPKDRGNIRKVLTAAGSNKKVLALVLGGGGGLIATIVVVFLMLIPLKIESIVTNLQNRFYATSEHAITNESENLLSSYIKKSVIPAMSKCPGSSTARIIDKSCNPAFGNSANPVDALFKGWQQARLENKLATQGIEFRSIGSGTNIKYYIKVTGDGSGSGPGEEITQAMAHDGGDLFQEVDFKPATRAEVRQAVKDSFQNETRWKQMFYRFKVGRLLEEKYGIKRCITDIGCKLTDKATDTIAKPTKAFQVYMSERVLMPRTQILGTVFQCLFIDPNCSPQDATSEPCTEGKDCEAASAPASDEDRQIQTKLDSLVARFAGEDAYKIFSDIQEKGGLQNYLISQVAKQIAQYFGGDAAGEAAGETASKALPAIGWINMASQILAKMQHIGPEAKKLAYVTNISGMIAMWSLYRSYTDEVHTGKVNVSEVGSWANSLGPNPTASANGGGGGGAEASPLYQTLMNDGGSASTSSQTALGSFLSPSAYAATVSPDPHAASTDLCNNGQPIKGELCDEEKLGQGNGLADALTAFTKLPGIDVITNLADFWNNTAGALIGAASNALGPVISAFEGAASDVLNLVPGYSALTGEAQQQASNLIDGAVNYLIPNPFNDNPSGDRNFELTAGGADGSGNESAHTLLGGEALTPAQTAAIVNDQLQSEQQDFQHQSFFARMFSTSSPYSLLSKVAMDIPIGTGTTAQTAVASFISHPLSGLFSGIGSLFSGSKALAATSAQADPFGIAQYGYPAGTEPTDPEAYWDANCTDNPSQAYQKDNTWNNSAAAHLDPNTEMPTNLPTDQGGAGVNACLLIKTTVGVAGGAFDSSLLTQDDTVDLGGGTSTSSSSGSSASSGQCSVTSPVYQAEYSQAQLAQIFGDPGTASSHPQMDANLTTVTFLGHSVQVNKLVAPCLLAVASQIQSENVNYAITEMGCYRFDSNNGTSNIGLSSYHTYGAACDINWDTNPFVESGAPTAHDMPQAYIDAFNSHGFVWGGSWTQPKDYMHFEFHGIQP